MARIQLSQVTFNENSDMGVEQHEIMKCNYQRNTVIMKWQSAKLVYDIEFYYASVYKKLLGTNQNRLKACYE